MLVVGAVIVLLDRKQVTHLLTTSNWAYLLGAILFTGISYIAGSASFIVVMRLFENKIRTTHLLNIGIASMVLQNLIGQPAGLSLRILLLGKHHVPNSQTVAASLLLAYFKNLLYFSLIPFSLIYIVVSHPLPSFGIATILLIISLLIVLLVVATGIAFYARLRAYVLRGIGHIWHFVSRRDIQKSLAQFNDVMTTGVDDLKKHRENRLPLAGTIVVDVASTIIALWFCFASLGIRVGIGVLITGFNFGITLTVISFIPGDMGVQEGSMALIFALFGVPFTQGVIVAILFRIVYYFLPFLGSLALYWSLLREKVAE
jgi:uncharacterized protein (TIRG00374 family)